MKSLLMMICMLFCGAAAAAPKALATWSEPVTGSTFVELPKGCFQMGTAKRIEPPWDSNWGWIGYKGHLAENETPKHEACVDRFWLAKTEVTEADWHKVMGGDPPADAGKRAKVYVTWFQAREFAERLTAMSGGKHRFRLPTEAEWEYACRAGSKVDDDPEMGDLEGLAWHAHSMERPQEAREVGQLKPNAFGLYDMLGNVWEWTQDSYVADGYARHALYNPKADVPDTPRVIRGGSFRTEAKQVRCAKRGRYEPAHTLHSFGMRLVREP